MKEEKFKYIYSKYDNINKPNFKRKDSKQTKVILLIKDYFNHHSLLTKDKFNEFLTFIDLKSIWSTKEEQNILWNSLLSYSSNKISIDYNAAMKGLIDLFKSDDEDIKNKSNNNDTIKQTIEAFEKYIKNIIGNQGYLYDIEFINYIFFDKDNIFLNNNQIENIINNIKLNYKFMTITEKEIKNYFNCFKSNINKDLINKINLIIENNLEQNKSNNIIFFEISNNNSRSISFSDSGNETNSNRNANSFSSNNGELFDKLTTLDKIIFDSMDSLINFYNNKNLIILTKKYIQSYILSTKRNIYNNLKVIIENDKKRKQSDSKKSVQNEETNNINNNINNNLIKRLNFNKIEKQKNKFSSKQDIFYINTNLNDSNKILNNDNINNNIDIDIDEIDNNLNFLSKNESKQQIFRKSILYKKANHNKNKSDSNEKMIFKFNNKLKKNESYCNFNKLNQIKEIDIFSINNKGQILSRNNYLTEKKVCQTQRDDDSSFFEGTLEDLNVFTFSDNNINDQLLLENENIDNIDYDKLLDKGTPTLNPIDLLDNKDPYENDDYEYTDDYFKENKNQQNIKKEKENEKEKKNLSKCQNPNNFTFGKDVNNKKEKILKIKLSGDIDVGMPNYIGSSNNLLSSSSQNKNKRFVKIGHYDFKYLYKNNHIKKLFTQNNDKLNAMNFLTDEVYLIPNNGLKKIKAILVISSSLIYILKSITQKTCLSKVSLKSLKSISISSRNCNLILFSFDKAANIFIETYRRFEVLRFIKEEIEKNVKINISHSFDINKKVGENDSINSKKSKIFINTPNFENAQKMGILYKYQENFFSASFHERLVVLCCLGLMYFEENEKCPKVIIPIIGTTIKSLTIKGVEKFYCFQLKVKNDEIYIFGSKIKKEIIDWINEFSLVKKKYFLRLKEIEPSIIIHQKNKFYIKKKVTK